MVLQLDCLQGDPVLVVLQLEHLLVDWAVLVALQVSHEADGDGNGKIYL